MTRTLAGHFRDSIEAQSAADELKRSGIAVENLRVSPGPSGVMLTVQIDESTSALAESVLRSAGASLPTSSGESGGFDPADPHTDAPNYGDEGGSSQWGRTVLPRQTDS